MAHQQHAEHEHPEHGYPEVVELLDSSDDDDSVVCVDDYIFTSDDGEEESDDPDCDSDSDVEWEVELVAVIDAPQVNHSIINAPPVIDLTGPDHEQDEDDARPSSSRARHNAHAPGWHHQGLRRQPRAAAALAAARAARLKVRQQRRQAQQQQRQQRQQQQRQQQQQDDDDEEHEQGLFPQDVLALFCDGSHRPRPRHAHLSMSAGVWAAGHSALRVASMLTGGAPDSTRAELGAVFVAATRLQTALRTGAVRTPAAVQICTDCKSCVHYLRPGAKPVKQKYQALVAAIRLRLQELRLLVPVSLRWVKGHATTKTPAAVGNNAAHKLAKHCSIHDSVCKLPTSMPGAL